ncbi:MAG: hypothetical protein Ct9H300mP32_0090 [Verrucomicrobiota bacterium]|nr:MAG: hypothetical protein Ct9H300mP32_0090 [Verrucomicrobiota bacterium]
MIDDTHCERVVRADDGEVDLVVTGEYEQRRQISPAPMPTHSTTEPLAPNVSPPMPALPGAHHICVAREDCASFQTRACSRPPPPITRIFIEF